MEESLKTVRMVHRLIMIIAATLIVVAISQEKPSTEYIDALAEFNLIEPAIDKVSKLHIQQDNIYYEKQGVKKVVLDVFSGVDTSEFRFVGTQDDRFGQPRFGAGTKAPLGSLYKYLLLTEDWEKQTVWEVDLKSFKAGLSQFRANHKDISKIGDIYI